MPTLLDPRLKPPAAPSRPAKPVPPPRSRAVFHFDPLLADTSAAALRSRKRLVIASVALHVVLFVGLVVLPGPKDVVAEPSLPITVVFSAPPPVIAETFRPPPPPRPLPPPKPVVREQPKAAPEPVKEIAPPPPIAKLDSPPVSVPAPPPAPKPQVRTDVFGGATKGLEVVTSKTSRIVAPAGGFDRVGTSTQGARETRVVADSAFGDARGDAPAGGKPGARGTVQAGGFDTGAVKVGTRPQRERPLAALDTGVEILSKPKPVYTEEARGLRIEGDVVLEVTFLASAQVLVLGVVEGLGHGLDQAAIEAAKKIRFTPARRSGQAVDHTATLRVVFRLA